MCRKAFAPPCLDGVNIQGRRLAAIQPFFDFRPQFLKTHGMKAVPFIEKAQGFAHNFACRTVKAAFDFFLIRSSSCGVRETFMVSAPFTYPCITKFVIFCYCKAEKNETPVFYRLAAFCPMFAPPGRAQTHASAQPRFTHVDNLRSCCPAVSWTGKRRSACPKLKPFAISYESFKKSLKFFNKSDDHYYIAMRMSP